jgi:exopolyphosphatase/guanosine-5'-triphosphate,3'-diphosphate pyrophosphatase
MAVTPLHAAIDVGSYSVKLRVARRRGDRWETVADEVEVTGLGHGEPRRDGLDPGGREATLAALQRMARTLAALGVREVVTVGTAVLRHAPDTSRFVEEVERRTGLVLEVISGETEARLTYLGAFDALAAPSSGLVACDIGGASTEFAWGRTGDPDGRLSLEIGTITLTRRFGLERAVDPATVAAAADAVAATLRELPVLPSDATLVGIGATPASLVALERGEPIADGEQVHGAPVAADLADRWVSRLRRLDARARRDLPGLHPDRAPVILAGAILTRGVLAHRHDATMRVSAHGLRRGLLVDRFGAR